MTSVTTLSGVDRDHDMTGNNWKDENANRLNFSDLCNTFELIHSYKARRGGGGKKKVEILFTESLKELLGDQSPFQLMRLVIPEFDASRSAYRIRQSMVAKLYMSVLGLAKHTADAQRLIHWKDPSKSTNSDARRSAGDLPLILEQVYITFHYYCLFKKVLRMRIGTEPSNKTVGEVNILLDALSSAVSWGEREEILKNLCNNFPPKEQKWIMRIIFKDLKIGLRHESVLKFFHPRASEALAQCCDLRRVCADFSGGSEKIASTLSYFNVFHPFSPMLAYGFKELSVDNIEKAMKGGPFVMDIKLDGERMVCHAQLSSNPPKIKWISRKATDYTELYQVMDKYLIAALEGKGVDKIVLDGEMISWDVEEKKFVPFGQNRTIAMEMKENPHQSDWMRHLFYIPFDIVYVSKVDGGGEMNLINQPLEVRRDVLEEIITPVPHFIEIVKEKRVVGTMGREARKQAIMTFFDEIVLNGEEGLVIKSLTSSYEFGERGRSKKVWVKMKPEYSDTTPTLDLLILAGYYGEGNRRSGGISHFLLGVIAREDAVSQSQYSQSPKKLSSKEEEEEEEEEDDGGVYETKGGEEEEDTLELDVDLTTSIGNTSSSSDDPPPLPTKFTTFCKVGTGYTLNQLNMIRNYFGDHLIPWEKGHLPPHFTSWKIGKVDDIPHVWIPPSKSLILTIKGQSLQPTTQFACGYTIRFPRVMEVRFDKEWYQCETYQMIQHLAANPLHTNQNLTNSYSDDEMEGIKNKKRKDRLSAKRRGGGILKAKRRGVGVVASHFQVTKMEDISNIKSYLFDREGEDGREFCVIEGGGGGGRKGKRSIQRGKNKNSSSSTTKKKKRYRDEDGSMMSRDWIGKSALETLILENGGSVIANPSEESIIIAPPPPFPLNLQHLIKSRKYDIVSWEWIMDCLDEEGFMEPKFNQYVSMNEVTLKEMRGEFDKFGDGYFEFTSIEDLKGVFDEITDQEEKIVEEAQQGAPKRKKARRGRRMDEEEEEEKEGKVEEGIMKVVQESNLWNKVMRTSHSIFANSPHLLIYVDRYHTLGEGDIAGEMPSYPYSDYNLFVTPRSISAYTLTLFSKNLDGRSIQTSSLSPTSHLLCTYGASLSPFLTPQVTHILVNEEEKDRFPMIRRRVRELRDEQFISETKKSSSSSSSSSSKKSKKIGFVEKRIISKKWVEDCINQGRLLEVTKEYEIPLTI